MKTFDKKLRQHNKTVYLFLKEHCFPTAIYAVEWFTTFYICSCPSNLASYVMDLLFMDCKDILLRVGLSIMDTMQSQLLNLTSDELFCDFKNIVASLNPLDVIPSALAINFHHTDSILNVSNLNNFYLFI